MLRSLPYLPTVIKDDSRYAAEGAAIDSDKIRFVRGKPESQEGYTVKNVERVSGYVRGGLVWADENGRSYIAEGTSSGLYVVVSNRQWDITPERVTALFPTSTWASVTSGSSEVAISFSTTEHGAQTGDYIHIWSASSVGGVEIGGYSSGLTSVGVTQDAYTATLTISGHGLSNGDFVAIPSTSSLTLGGYQFTGPTASTGTNVVYTTSGLTAVRLNTTNHGLYPGDLVSFSGLTAVAGITLSGSYYVEYVDDVNNYYVEATTAATATSSGGGASGTYDGARVFRVRKIDDNTLLVYIDEQATETTSGGAGTPIYTARRYAVTTSGNYDLTITGSGTASSTTSGGGASAMYQFGIKGGRVNTTGTGFGTGAYGVGTYGSFAGGADLQSLEARIWNMDNFGIWLLSSPRGGRMYMWQLNPSRRTAWLTNAPEKNLSIQVTQERVIVSGGCINTDLLFDPMVVRNSDILAPNVWTPDFDNSAGDARLGVGSAIVQMRNLENGFLVWTDTAVYLGTYTANPDQLYRFGTLGINCGLLAPFSFAERDGQSFWINSQYQFFTFAGGRPRQIANPNRDWFENTIDKTQVIKIWAYLDTKYGAVVWLFPTTTTADPGEVDTYLRYDFSEAEVNPLYGWSVGTYQRTTWLPAGTLDSDVAFDWDGYLYDQGVGNSADGAAITRYIRYAPIDLSSPEVGDGTFKLRWSRLVPDGVLGSNTTLQVRFYGRDWPNDAENEKGPYTWTNSVEKIDVRLQFRQIGLEVRSVGTDDEWRIGNIRADLTGGQRR